MKIQIILACALMCIFSNTGNAQVDAKAEKILQKCIEASGGRAKWEAVQTIRVKMLAKMDNGLNIEIINIIKRPGKVMTKITTNGHEMESRYANGKAIEIVDGKVDSIKNKRSLLDMKILSNDIIEELAYLRPGFRIAMLKPEKIDSTMCNKLEIVSPDGIKRIRFYSAKTGLLKMYENERGEIHEMLDFIQYKGLTMVKTIRVKYSNGQEILFVVTEVSVNSKIDDKIFEP